MSGTQQSLRREARRRVGEALLIKQREREAREKRLTGHAVSILTALAERDAAVGEAELAAATAIHEMLAEGATATEIAGWCGGALDGKEISRLAKLHDQTGE
jgi:hypothetical protein